ncbi:hypothetical protein [Microbacterium sp. Marseille-Q6965]|uniref:hypothetical protein n=1 Tax=Microbacterium sp. Marseille-Q6965 TaxID=2965072 RepID=UPI0021B6FD9D|nr:hypothetical protein [Microbacterium sp. Marseille-Q6965]
MDSYWAAVVWSLLPTIAIAVVFWYVLRSILRFDRTERRAYAKIEAEERAKRGLAPRADGGSAGASGAAVSPGSD